jgi:S-adenosylmethionine-diacylglycerol 3-amino-3-carboxypropyl transferase
MANAVRERLHTRVFHAVHRNNLLYNTCWEDPALDRIALKLTSTDRLLVITSAGCNALDYLLAGCGEVHAVDMNPIQNSLIELKRAAALSLDYDDFFAFFGNGRLANARQLYQSAIRHNLPIFAKEYWDKHMTFFAGKGWRDSFYFRGTSGLIAKLLSFNILKLARLRRSVEKLVEAKSIHEQEEIYRKEVSHKLWTPMMRWFLKRRLTMTMVGVPGPQLDQITRQYPGGLFQFIKDRVEQVLVQLPFRENYFWRVYLEGRYTKKCCPEYLREENFGRLKEAMSRLHVHTGKVTDVVKASDKPFSRFVLLDHMDWMSHHDPKGLVEEWNAILEKSAPKARVLFRSAGLREDFLDTLLVRYQGANQRLGGLLNRQTALAEELHLKDRVNTYGSFHIVDLP